MPGKPRNTLLEDSKAVFKLLDMSLIPVRISVLAIAMGISYKRTKEALEKLITEGLVLEVPASDSQSISHAKLYKINR